LRVVLGVSNYSLGYGIPQVVQGTAKELVREGIDVSILCGKTNLQSDVSLIECGYNETLKHVFVTKALKTLLSIKPDIFHSHYYPMDFCGALASSKIRHVMHVHGVIGKEHWVNTRAAFECLRSSISEKIGLRFSTKAIAISRFLKSEILRKHAINEDKVEVIYPWVDLNLFSPHNRSGLLANETSEDGVKMVSVGAVSHRKGQHLLIDAMRKVVAEEPRARLFLIGRTGEEDPSYLVQLNQRIRKFGLEKNISIKGFVPATSLPAAYAAADLFVTGTMWEGFGIPLAEAMASGVPVVAFDTTSMHELVADEFNGLKARPFDTKAFGNQVLILIQNRKLRRKMGENARLFAERRFSVKNVHQILKIYSAQS